MKSFSNYINEGINDPAIFKAIFLAGGPGSGKSFIAGKTALTALGMRVVNSDDAFEAAMSKAGLSLKTDTFTDRGQEIRSKAVALTGKKLEMYIQGRLGLVIDGTGKDYDKIVTQAKELKKLGYDVAMIVVNTDLETALKRNALRDRSLPSSQVIKMWNAVQSNLGKFQSFFRNKIKIIDNSSGSDWEKGTQSAYKWATKFTKAAPDTAIAKKWISQQRNEEYIALEESSFENSILNHIAPWLTQYIDKKINAKAYQSAVKYWLKLRKKNPGDARKNLVKTAQVYDVDARTLDRFFRGMVDKGLMPSHLIKYQPLFKEEGGAGEWGTDKLTKKYKKDTPGEN